MAPGSLLAARLRQYWEWLLGIHRGLHGVVWGLRRYGAPWECYTGLQGQPAGPRGGDEAKECA